MADLKILEHPNLTPEEVKLLTKVAGAAYDDTPNVENWTAITPNLPGLSKDLIKGDSYTKAGTPIESVDEYGNVIAELPSGDANATIFANSEQEPTELILAFRGTELPKGDNRYWTNFPVFYDLFTELFDALDSYVSENETISRVLVTGHSLGAAMVEYFMEEKLAAGSLDVDYQAVAVASPTASRISTEAYNDRVLNIGYQNDVVYSLRLDKDIDPANATSNIYIDIGSINIVERHSTTNYAYTVNRILNSEVYDQMARDSLVIVDKTDEAVNAFAYYPNKENTFVLGEEADDELIGTYFTSDFLEGGKGNDNLDGDEGEDTAVFSDVFENYKYSIDKDTNIITFTHVRGTLTDGTDTLEKIEFAQFSDRLVPLPLEDGPEATETSDIIDLNGEKDGEASLTLPSYTFDRDADYTLTLSSADAGIQYNLAYIIDVSRSMQYDFDSAENIVGENTKLVDAKAAYTSLTQYLTDEEIPSQFVVIPFSDSASLIGPQNTAQTVSTINGLSADGNTNFNAPLQLATAFFEDANPNATNIAYFLSDGLQNRGGDFAASAAQLQNLADVRAFGIGNADIGQLNRVDSNNAVFLNSSSGLESEFTTTSGFDRDDIARIDLILDTDANDNVEGNIVKTIQPNKLLERPLGLQFTGSIDELDVAIDAENQVTAEVVYNDGRPNTIVDFIVTAGQGIGSGTDGDDNIRFGATEIESNAGAGDDRVLGNRLDNIIRGGSGNDEIIGSDGNDRIFPGEGDDLVDGSEGIDTVVYTGTLDQVGPVNKVGEIVEVGSNTDILINVEFIEFSDTRLAVDTLAVTPAISLDNNSISVTEGNTGSTNATFTVNLSSVATEDVVIDYATGSDSADSGTDFVETTGQLTIAAGESSGEINLEILGDTDIEGNEAVFLDLSVVSGGTFADGAMTQTVGVNIVDDDSADNVIFPSIISDEPTVVEGNSDAPSTLTLTLDRFGGLSESNTVEVEIIPAGDNPAQASDFVNGFSSRQVTFAPDEYTKAIGISISPDQEIEGDETFGVKLTNVSGSALVPDEDTIFTIIDDDTDNTQPSVVNGTSAQDKLIGTDASDRFTGSTGRDTLTGGGGSDQFVYTSIVEAGDTITDFKMGVDQIVFAEVLDRFNYQGEDAIADGYVQFESKGSNTLVKLDPDGLVGSGRSRAFVLVENVTVSELNNADNFIFS